METFYQTKQTDRFWGFGEFGTIQRKAGCVFWGPKKVDPETVTEFDYIDVTYTVELDKLWWQVFTSISPASKFKGNVYTEYTQNGPEGYTMIDADKNTVEILGDQGHATFGLPENVASELLADMRQLRKSIMKKKLK